MNNLSDLLADKAQEFTKSPFDLSDLDTPQDPIRSKQSDFPQSFMEENKPAVRELPSEQPDTASTGALQDVVRELKTMRNMLDTLLAKLDQGFSPLSFSSPTSATQIPQFQTNSFSQPTESTQMIEGVFDGQHMIGPDGKEYHVPPNYASKSKIVEGDMMKLTITPNGAFVFKQIGPTPRKRIVGELIYDGAVNQWSVVVNGKPYKILTASVTFYKGKSGDEVVILVPEHGQSAWGAVENIIHT